MLGVCPRSDFSTASEVPQPMGHSEYKSPHSFNPHLPVIEDTSFPQGVAPFPQGQLRFHVPDITSALPQGLSCVSAQAQSSTSLPCTPFGPNGPFGSGNYVSSNPPVLALL